MSFRWINQPSCLRAFAAFEEKCFLAVVACEQIRGLQDEIGSTVAAVRVSGAEGNVLRIVVASKRILEPFYMHIDILDPT